MFGYLSTVFSMVGERESERTLVLKLLDSLFNAVRERERERERERVRVCVYCTKIKKSGN